MNNAINNHNQPTSIHLSQIATDSMYIENHNSRHKETTTTTINNIINNNNHKHKHRDIKFNTYDNHDDINHIILNLKWYGPLTINHSMYTPTCCI